MGVRLCPLRNAQFFEFRRNVVGMGRGMDVLVDKQDVAVLADEKRPSARPTLHQPGDAVLAGDFPAVIAEDRVVGPDRFGKFTGSSPAYRRWR